MPPELPNGKAGESSIYTPFLSKPAKPSPEKDYKLPLVRKAKAAL